MAHWLKPPLSSSEGYDVDNKLAPGSLWRVGVPLGGTRTVALSGGDGLKVKSNNPRVVPNQPSGEVKELARSGDLRLFELFGASEGGSFIDVWGKDGAFWIRLQALVAAPAGYVRCRVKTFRAAWSNWNLSWRWTASGKSTIRLPVKFTLELEAGSSKGDCIVGQEKRGRMQNDNTPPDIFPNWTADGDIGERYWWDGSKLARSGHGEWDSAGTVATFSDEPGFNDAPGSLYMGAAAGPAGAGYFDFRTFVKDRATGKAVREINWSMRINVPNPGKGGLWWSFSDQK